MADKPGEPGELEKEIASPDMGPKAKAAMTNLIKIVEMMEAEMQHQAKHTALSVDNTLALMQTSCSTQEPYTSRCIKVKGTGLQPSATRDDMIQAIFIGIFKNLAIPPECRVDPELCGIKHMGAGKLESAVRRNNKGDLQGQDSHILIYFPTQMAPEFFTRFDYRPGVPGALKQLKPLHIAYKKQHKPGASRVTGQLRPEIDPAISFLPVLPTYHLDMANYVTPIQSKMSRCYMNLQNKVKAGGKLPMEFDWMIPGIKIQTRGKANHNLLIMHDKSNGKENVLIKYDELRAHTYTTPFVNRVDGHPDEFAPQPPNVLQKFKKIRLEKTRFREYEPVDIATTKARPVTWEEVKLKHKDARTPNHSSDASGRTPRPSKKPKSKNVKPSHTARQSHSRSRSPSPAEGADPAKHARTDSTSSETMDP